MLNHDVEQLKKDVWALKGDTGRKLVELQNSVNSTLSELTIEVNEMVESASSDVEALITNGQSDIESFKTSTTESLNNSNSSFQTNMTNEFNTFKTEMTNQLNSTNSQFQESLNAEMETYQTQTNAMIEERLAGFDNMASGLSVIGYRGCTAVGSTVASGYIDYQLSSTQKLRHFFGHASTKSSVSFVEPFDEIIWATTSNSSTSDCRSERDTIKSITTSMLSFIGGATIMTRFEIWGIINL